MFVHRFSGFFFLLSSYPLCIGGSAIEDTILVGFYFEFGETGRLFSHLGRLYSALILMGNECFEALR